MPMYIFYPCLEDGTANSFEAYELTDDAAAAEQGELVLAGHASASHVMIWRDGQPLEPVRRATTGPRPAGDAPQA
jgi:hypothetical protein